MAVCTRCVGNISVLLIGYFMFTVVGISAKKEIELLQVGGERGWLNWTTKIVKAEPPDEKNRGWEEVNAHLPDIYQGGPIALYTSCQVSSRDVNNWLRTPYIRVGNAKRLTVNMTFTMRTCSNHNDPISLIQCRETFELYSYEAARDFANDEMPSWDDISYKSLGKVTADKLYENTNEVLLNVQKKEVPLTKDLPGIYFAFRDTGSCVSLLKIEIYYIACPDITENYALFSETPTGKESSSSVAKQGECVPNSSMKNTPMYHCMSDGSWDIPQGECQCHPGFMGVDGATCVPCPKGQYKWETGDSQCHKCPANSYTNDLQSIKCDCLNNFFRAETDKSSSPCTKPPSKPTQLKQVQLTDTSIWLSWQPPEETGGRVDLTYRVECPSCKNGSLEKPLPSGFNKSQVEITHLKPGTDYTFRIYSQNGVSQVSNRHEYAQHEFTTQKAMIMDLEATNIGDTSITIVWKTPDDPTMVILQYEIIYYAEGESGNHVNVTLERQFTFQNLVKDTNYYVKVRGETEKGWGQPSQLLEVCTCPSRGDEKEEKMESGPSLVIIVGSIVAVILCMGIAAGMIIILFRRNRRSDGKNPDIDGPYAPGPGITAPLFQPSGTIKSYVDPHTYEDPNQAVREFTREIDSSHITIEAVIGGGEFGDVCKGKLRVPSRMEMSVAIKTLKPGATDKNRLDFLTEASIMGQFDDPNVIFLEGVVTKTHPIMIVTEYMANGSLDSFLRNNDGQLTVIQLVGMMRGIASGMRYLSEMGYVHRDLAARNILCNESLVCKVADFGLSREVDIDTTDGAYTTKGGKIPVRWTAPEAITFRKFTSSSDVWSFGVVMWEVISYGERPYWNWSNQDVIMAVEKGYRLPPPMECPEAVHQLMLDAWQKDRNHRPKFIQIVKTLDKLIRSPELLRKMAKPRPHVFIKNSPAETSNFTSIDEWLNAIKMERYHDNFVAAGVTSMDMVVRLTVKHLDTFGITLLGHQKKIMNSVQTLRAQLLGPEIHLPHMHTSEGFLV